MADNILAVNDGNFEVEVLTASKTQPVMVDFWAEWCRPCHMLAPTVAEIAQDYAGKLKVTKLNVDEAMNSAGRFNIRGIPTLLVFKDGEVVEQIVGAVPKDQITRPSRATSHKTEFRGSELWLRSPFLAGNANLLNGGLKDANDANREIGVPGVRVGAATESCMVLAPLPFQFGKELLPPE